MSSGMLIDTTKCVGCRSCQVTCKQWNQLPAEHTQLNGDDLGLQNPKTVSASTYTLITYHEVPDASAPGGLKYVFTKRQCMHCNDPACASACPTTAMHKTKEGPVVYDSSKCIGCRYCVLVCPFGVPTADWNTRSPRIHKCDLCYGRLTEPTAPEQNGKALSPEARKDISAANSIPACVKQCPAGALEFGTREELLARARKRIADHPGSYVDHIYGEHEAGGTGVLYLASVPFRQLGFLDVAPQNFTTHSATALRTVSPAVVGVGALLGATYALHKRREEVATHEPAAAAHIPAQSKAEADHHPSFAPVKVETTRKVDLLLKGVLAWGAVSWAARLLFGLGGSTNLSDTYPWGLWIVFDLIWIALAAGAFTMAGLIYILRREDLYSVGRSAVLIGFLSYLFVSIILVADLGLPWHAWQFALNIPKHSAMFEVAWCVGLYLSILAFEFLPVPFEHWSIRRGLELWRKYNALYVVLAVTYFVYLMSHNLAWSAAAMGMFGMLAYAFRPRAGEKPTPIMLALAAVTLSMMHQSSLGSLFLLMSDKLSHVWWSPIMPIEFLLSAIAGGIATIILLEVGIAKGFGRELRLAQLTALAKVVFWAVFVYDIVRVGDLAYNHQLSNALQGPKNLLFLIEAALCIVPLIVFGLAELRKRPGLLVLGAACAAGEVIVNRSNAVLFAMTLKGPMPQIAHVTYMPSFSEWGIALAPVAATIMLFTFAAKTMPILPREAGIQK